MKKTLLAAFLAATTPITAQASSYDGIYTPIVQFKAGDLIVLPNREGTYIMALWGQQPVFYNGQTHWFQFEAIRNWQTVKVDVTLNIPAGDYQFLEVAVQQPGGDPNNLADWRWVREYKAEIVDCDYFVNYNYEFCNQPVKRK
jgi:hypothetical protein